MREKSRQTLITAEILGFFLIIIAVLALLTGRRVFIIAAMVLFSLIILVAALFAVFFTLAVRQEKGKAHHKHTR
jgi:glucan phosphoethanolaminetransferase (alkaline phosphatase superfamily)